MFCGCLPCLLQVRKKISQEVDKCMKEVGEKAFMIKKSIDRLKNSNIEFENSKDEGGSSNKVRKGERNTTQWLFRITGGLAGWLDQSQCVRGVGGRF